MVTFISPAIIISFTLQNDGPRRTEDTTALKYGARMIVLLTLLTITSNIILHSFFYISLWREYSLGSAIWITLTIICLTKFPSKRPKRTSSIPDDHIDPRRSALFLARSVPGGYSDGRHQYLFDVIAKRHRHQRYRQPFRRVMNLRGSWLNAMQPLRRLSGNGANATVLSITAPHRLQTTLTTAQQAVAGMHCAKRDGCR